MTSPTVLFDLDGTLVDTAILHTVAWWRALDEADEHAPMSAIQPLIGLASTELLTTLLGYEDPAISERHGEHFASMHGLVRPLPGAPELVRAVHDRGAGVVVVTSAKERDLDALLGSLDCGDAIDDVVHDVPGPGKPAPDVLTVALERAGCSPEEALVVGDSVWDVEAARRAGIVSVGLETGGNAPERLVEAGAAAVYRTCAELLELWPATPFASLLDAPGAGAPPLPVVSSGTHGPEVTTQLTVEHERSRRLVADLRQLHEPAARREALFRLASLLARHEAAEQEAVYPVLDKIAGGARLRETAVAQERALDRALLSLLRRSTFAVGRRALRRRLARFEEQLAEHSSFEEEQVFPALRANEDVSKRQMMGAWVAHAERVAPIRPHPRLPRRLASLAVLAPPLAAADRLRERFRRTG
jgi:HAD superfamily hydrolase (TIGR01509 family)